MADNVSDAFADAQADAEANEQDAPDQAPEQDVPEHMTPERVAQRERIRTAGQAHEPAGEPEGDAPTGEQATGDAPATPNREGLSKLSKKQAKKAPAPKFTPAREYGCDWVESELGGHVSVCFGPANRDGHRFVYLVYQARGKETALPLRVVEEAQAAGQI